MHGGPAPRRAGIGVDRVEAGKAQYPPRVKGIGIGLQPIDIRDGYQLRANGYWRHGRRTPGRIVARRTIERAGKESVTLSAPPLRPGHRLQPQPETGGDRWPARPSPRARDENMRRAQCTGEIMGGK